MKLSIQGLTLSALALGVLISTGCDSVFGSSDQHGAAHPHSGSAHEGHHKAGAFPATHPLRTKAVITEDYVCQIRAHQHIELRALERGYLEEVLIDEGQPVTRGQPMFAIMKRIYQAELNKARAEAEAARIEFENTKSLESKKVVSEQELALANAKLEQAKAEVALREAHLELSSISAPFDGIMGLLKVRRGSLLEEGELLTTLSDNSEMWVYFNVTESEYLQFRAAGAEGTPSKVQLVLANGQIFPHQGMVKTSSAEFNNETGTIMFRATFPNPEGLLRHGQTGNIRVTNELHDAIIIPQKAVFEILDGRYVFVIDKGGLIQQRRIEIEAELPHRYVISNGLTEKDLILLEGLRRVTNGQHISPEVLDANEVMSRLALPAD